MGLIPIDLSRCCIISGDGFTWDTQDREKDIQSALKGWEKSKELILNKNIKFVLLDEINIALRYKYLDIEDVINFLLKFKPEMTHVVLTGRNADPKLIEIADLVTEMKLIKHPFKQGIQAQLGIEY